jgi:4-aminobutyrate aminotransferase
MLETDRRYLSPSYERIYPLAVESGEGAVIVDVDGNRFLDFTAGIAVCGTGHCHPRVVAAIQRQAQRLIHMSGTDFCYGPQQDLAQKLAEIAPGPAPKQVFFTNSGAEAVEAAFKLARFHTRRQQMIAFTGAFHGRTLGALSLTGSKMVQRRGFAPLVPGVSHVDFAHCYRCPKRPAEGSCCLESIRQIESLLQRMVAADEIAAVIVEPIQGEGGYIVPPLEFHRQLKALCEKHGILYIVDEVQTGMGRTGKMFAIEHWGIEPDIICLAKGIASGMPLGAIIARADLMNWPPGSHASTFGGNPISCAAALETIALLEEGLMDNARRMGEFLLSSLRGLADRQRQIGDVRGKGLMVGVELVRDRASKAPVTALRNGVVQRAFNKGLLLLGCGESTVRFCPPLVIDQEQAKTAVAIFAEALSEAAEQHAR